ncbi:hypothetical protein [Nocardioides sp.]|uniref:hypothetical protein n=1 Tax=Nocardioides sp. TaxID=35761 RepID=UPI0027199ECF|nr:hypothetical protein [Nocardioides sp.]MDO9456646.1 hypothetical protein [Nocardioides sp.]
MSKTDELRAMREAKYARARAASGRAPAPTGPTSKATPAKPPVAPEAGATKPTTEAAGGEPATDAVCGHRNMSGRTCTREQGHAAKSHRYS